MTSFRRSFAMLAAVVANASLTVEALTVEARAVTNVAVDAPAFDARSSEPYGCPPAGCQGINTRDGSSAAESRWSCKPSLSTSGTGCSITYTLEEAQHLYALEIDMYLGQYRARTLEVYVDGELATTWTSSGNSDGFETVPIPLSDAAHSASSIELHGVLADSEWISIEEVNIWVDVDELPPTPAPVTPPPAVPTSAPTFIQEAPAFGTNIVVTADLYDTRLAADNGCDPAGCVPMYIRRASGIDDRYRWSCKPELGGPGAKCSVRLDVGAVYPLKELRLAFYKGDQRTRTMEIYIDGALSSTYTSSGVSTDFEIIDLFGTSGRVIDITGLVDDSEWFSIVESEVWVAATGPGLRL